MNKIKKGLELPAGKYGKVEIPDCSRRDLPKFFKEMGLSTGVEIGVQRGAFTRRLLNAGLTVYGVDPWEAYPEYYPNDKFASRQKLIHEEAIKNTAKYPKCKLIRKTSMDALSDFEDNSLGFCYIDGNHGFKFITEDIWGWSKKVKKGGVIACHDYAIGKIRDELHPWSLQVKFVIDAWVQAFRIEKWYVIGRKKKLTENESRDSFRSCFWFKK